MRPPHTIAVSLALLLAAACGHESPAKTASDTTTAAATPAEQAAPSEPEAPGIPETGRTTADVPREGPMAGSTEAQTGTELTDGQILQVTHTANTGEIAQGKLALSKSKDTRVLGFAQMMVHDHTQADDKGMAIAKKNSIARQQSPTSEALKSDAESATNSLKVEPAGDFDAEYIATQVREHKAVLDMLDQKLIVNATNPDVKAYLAEVRAAVTSHLQQAQDLQKASQK
jgi:putative membrane protein